MCSCINNMQKLTQRVKPSCIHATLAAACSADFLLWQSSPEGGSAKSHSLESLLYLGAHYIVIVLWLASSVAMRSIRGSQSSPKSKRTGFVGKLKNAQGRSVRVF